MTILRAAEHKALSAVSLTGRVADLGGEKDSGYRRLIGGTFTAVTFNLADKQPDVIADLEQPMPAEKGSFDGAILSNILEHVFEYRALLGEVARILRPGGTVVILVPFLFPYHPSPGDFHRFSKSVLERSLTAAGFKSIRILPLGSGVFAARYLMIERLLPGRLQDLIGPVVHALTRTADALFSAIAHKLGKKYDPADYALGFLATALSHGPGAA